MMGPQALVLRLRSCTNVMNVTAAAVEDVGAATGYLECFR